MEVPHRHLEPLNTAWKNDSIGRFKKRRELHWVTGPQLLRFYSNEPDRLWTRVRELETGPAIVKEIISQASI